MRLDAVLPLTLNDAARADLLLESLQQHLTGLRVLWIICPAAHLAALTARYANRALSFEIRVKSELEVVPEFALKLRQSGWFRQQMIKLAMYEHVAGDLYLTLDADVVCARPVSAAQLAGTGRGACRIFAQTQFDYWYERVEQVLRLKAPRRGVVHNVTPALLHRGAVGDLVAHLQALMAAGRYSQGLRGWKQRWQLFWSRREPRYAPWRVFLMAARPWTEYALYYTFLEASGRFERYHQPSPVGIYDADRSLWVAEHGQLPDDWDPSPAFTGAGPPWFIVAQSNTGISADQIRDKLAPLLAGHANAGRPNAANAAAHAGEIAGR